MPSRRELLGAIGFTGAVAVAGCVDALPEDATRRLPGDPEPTGAGSDSGPTGDPLADDAAVRVTLTIEETRPLFESRHVKRVGPVKEGRTGRAYVPLQLTELGVETVTERAAAAELADRYADARIAVTVDGERREQFEIEEPLAAAIVDGEWSGAFRVTFEDGEAATAFRATLVSDSS